MSIPVIVFGSTTYTYVAPSGSVEFSLLTSEYSSVASITGCVSGSTDGFSHLFTLTVPAGATAGYGTLVLEDVVATGGDGASDPTDITLPVTVVTGGPGEVSSLSGSIVDGSLVFTWEPAIHSAGSGAMRRYEVEISQDGTPISNVELNPEDTAIAIPVTGAGGAGDTYTCQVTAVGALSLSGSAVTSSGVAVDTQYPTCVVSATGVSETNMEEINISIAFSLPVTLVDLSKIQTSNASKQSVSGSSTDYTLTIKPTQPGVVTVRVPAGSYFTTVGNPNLQSNLFSFEFNRTSPTCRVSSPKSPSNTATPTFELKFSEAVSISDFSTGLSLTNASLASVSPGTGTPAEIFSVIVTPTDSPLGLQVASGAGTDRFGNTSLVSNEASLVWSVTAPTVTGTTGSSVTGTVFGFGQTLDILVQTDETVFVSPPYPYLELILPVESTTGSTRSAYYSLGSGTNTLTFSYIVSESDPPTGGSIEVGSLVATGITNLAGNPLDAGGLTSITGLAYQVDPTVVSVEGINSAVTQTLLSATGTKLTASSLQSGIGDGDQLLARITSDGNENWTPKINTGWFYYQGTEYYLYANKQTVSVTGHTSKSGIDLSVTDVEDYDNTAIASYGPIIVSGVVSGSTTPYVQVAPSLRVVGLLTGGVEATGTGFCSYTISGIPVDLYRESLDFPMRKVPTTGAVQDSNEYCLEVSLTGDVLDYKISVLGTTSIYATYIPTVSPQFSVDATWCQQEIAKVSSTRTIKTMYKAPIDTTGTLSPKIVLLQDGVYTEITGSVSGNTFTLPASYTDSSGSVQSIRLGTLVGIKYWINHCWALEDNYLYAFHTDSPNPLAVTYEGSIDPVWDSSLLDRSSKSYTQFNPRKDGVTSGFLYLIEEPTTVQNPTDILLTVAPSSVTVSGSNSQPVRVVATTVDVDGNPLQGVSVQLLSTESLLCVERGTGSVDTIKVPSCSVTSIVGLQTYIETTDYTATYNSSDLEINWGDRKPTLGETYTVTIDIPAGSFLEETVFPKNKQTGWLGQISAMWKPSFPATAVISATGGGLESDILIQQVSLLELIAAGRDKTYLTLTKTPDSKTLLARAYICDSSGATPRAGQSVTFKTTSGKYAVTGPVTTSVDGVAENTYYPVGEDTIWADYNGVESNRIYLPEDLNA